MKITFLRLLFFLFLPPLLVSCGEDPEPDHAAKYIGTYRGSAQERYRTVFQPDNWIDTTYTDVVLSITRNETDNKKVDVWLVSSNGKSLKFNGNVEAYKERFFDSWGDRGCMCAHTVEGSLDGKNLKVRFDDSSGFLYDKGNSLMTMNLVKN